MNRAAPPRPAEAPALVLDNDSLFMTNQEAVVKSGSSRIKLTLSVATALHKGDRETQQDQITVMAHPNSSQCLLAVLCDGMGGRSGGRRAAEQVNLVAKQVFNQFSIDKDPAESLFKQIIDQSQSLLRVTAISAVAEPHCTLVLLLIMPNMTASLCHIGDSRYYIFHGQAPIARSKDHSLVQRLVEAGQITEQEALVHPKANLLTHCLGMQDVEMPLDVKYINTILAGDSFLMCSDGLWHQLTDTEIGVSVQTANAETALRRLVRLALARAKGRSDNISAVLIKFTDARLSPQQ